MQISSAVEVSSEEESKRLRNKYCIAGIERGFSIPREVLKSTTSKTGKVMEFDSDDDEIKLGDELDVDEFKDMLKEKIKEDYEFAFIYRIKEMNKFLTIKCTPKLPDIDDDIQQERSDESIKE